MRRGAVGLRAFGIGEVRIIGFGRVWPVGSWHDQVGHGLARITRQGRSGQDVLRSGEDYWARFAMDRLGMVRLGKEYRTRHGRAGQGKARRGEGYEVCFG